MFFKWLRPTKCKVFQQSGLSKLSSQDSYILLWACWVLNHYTILAIYIWQKGSFFSTFLLAKISLSLILYFGVMRSMIITDVPQTISIDFEKQRNWGHFLFYGLFWPNFYVALKGKSKRRPANIIKNVFSCKAKVKIWKCILCTFFQSHFRVYFFVARSFDGKFGTPLVLDC